MLKQYTLHVVKVNGLQATINVLAMDVTHAQGLALVRDDIAQVLNVSVPQAHG